MRQIRLFSLAKFNGVIALISCLIPVNAIATSSIPDINPPPTTLTQPKTPIILASTYDSQLLELTNAERRKAGLPPFRLSPQLGQAAQFHAEDMLKNNYFDHTGANGSQPWDRAKAAGYSGSYIGENIAAGSASPSDIIRQWMNSPGHRANILSRDYTEIGFGYVNAPSTQYRNFWVQVFGTPSGGSSSSSPIQSPNPSDTTNPLRRIRQRRDREQTSRQPASPVVTSFTCDSSGGTKCTFPWGSSNPLTFTYQDEDGNASHWKLTGFSNKPIKEKDISPPNGGGTITDSGRCRGSGPATTYSIQVTVTDSTGLTSTPRSVEITCQ